MPNFDNVFGLDIFLASFDLVEPVSLYAVQFLLLISTILITLVVGTIIRPLSKLMEWLLIACLAQTFFWSLIHGLLLLLFGEELSMARYLYVYFGVLIMICVSQIHLNSIMPKEKSEN